MKKMATLSASLKWAAIAATAAGLVACGGGDGGVAGSSSTMSISGTAATGKALDGAAITVQCALGTGSATADGSGSYLVSIQNGQGPCVLTATKGATVLRSIAQGAGVANISPLTDLLVKFLAARAGTTPAAMASNATAMALLADTNAVNEAQAKVAAVLQQNYGIALTTPNFLTAPITPPSAGATQSESDKDLDNLKTKKVVSETGVPAATVASDCESEGHKQPYIPPTGGYGSAR